MGEQAKAKNTKPETTPTDLFEQYFYSNLMWWGFLVVLAVIYFFTSGAVWDDVTSGVMEFIFVILGGGFLLVSVLDFVYEKYKNSEASEGKK